MAFYILKAQYLYGTGDMSFHGAHVGGFAIELHQDM